MRYLIYKLYHKKWNPNYDENQYNVLSKIRYMNTPKQCNLDTNCFRTFSFYFAIFFVSRRVGLSNQSKLWSHDNPLHRQCLVFVQQTRRLLTDMMCGDYCITVCLLLLCCIGHKMLHRVHTFWMQLVISFWPRSHSMLHRFSRNVTCHRYYLCIIEHICFIE